MAFHFLNVDIDLLTPQKPTALLRALRLHEAIILRSDPGPDGWVTWFEMSGITNTP